MLRAGAPFNLPWSEARPLFDTVYRIRYLVMHAQPFDNAAFIGAVEMLRNVLGRIEVNVDRALERIEKRNPHDEDRELFAGPVVKEPVQDRPAPGV
jgi:hypothetical protein